MTVRVIKVMGQAVSAYDALKLTRRLLEEVSHTIFFAQALVNSASVEDITALNVVIKHSANLRSNVMSGPLRRQHENIKLTDRGIAQKTKKAILRDTQRKVFKVKR